MTRMCLVATLAISFAASAYAQQTQWIEPASPKALPEQAESKVDSSVPQVAMDRKRGQHDADARECLQMTTNGQIHRCAEKYRSHVGGVKLVKAARPAKVADTSSDATKPGETSKAAEAVSAGVGVRPAAMVRAK